MKKYENINIELLENLIKKRESYELGDKNDLGRIALYTRNDRETKQELLCNCFLEYNNCIYSDINFYRDNRTGIEMKSSIIEDLLNAIKTKKIDTVLCLSIDKISRNMVDFITFLNLIQENNVRLVVIR